LTRGRAATPEPFDLGAVAGSDELFEALSARRLADLNTGPAGSGDPAAALLAALVADVDAGAPPLPTPKRGACGLPGSRRRGVRAFVTLGVAALVLTSAGAAAAGGGNDIGSSGTPHGPGGLRVAERSNANVHKQIPVLDTPLTARRVPAAPHAPHAADRHPSTVPSPEADVERAPADEPPGHRKHRPSRSRSHAPAGVRHGPPASSAPSSPPADITPTPVAEKLPLLP
jgi:hypothetical protein